MIAAACTRRGVCDVLIVLGHQLRALAALTRGTGVPTSRATALAGCEMASYRSCQHPLAVWQRPEGDGLRHTTLAGTTEGGWGVS